MKYEWYAYELNHNIMSIWSEVYDEALHSDRYKGDAMVWVNYDVLNRSMKDWGQIQKVLVASGFISSGIIVGNIGEKA